MASRGQALAEYSLILVLVAIAALGALGSLGANANNAIGDIGEQIEAAASTGLENKPEF